MFNRKLDASEVAGACRLRSPEFDADVVLFAFLFPLELFVSMLYDMTLLHSCAVWSGSVATTSDQSVLSGVAVG
jgi:hypothetical protein